MNSFYPLTVTEVHRDTREAVVLTLQPRSGERNRFHYLPGQYLTLRTVLDGEEIRRCYSICAAPQDPAMRVAVKRVSGGRFSTWANARLEPGQVLDAMPPAGAFTLTVDAARPRHYVAFAAGSGITPILGIVKSALQGEPGSRFTLFYGNRASATVMFREELEDLKNAWLGRFNLVHILSREQQDIELFNGRIDAEKCAQLFRYWLDVRSVDLAFVCGPQEMMLAVSAALRDQGLDRDRIRFELFASESEPRAGGVAAAVAAEDGEHCEATIILDGHARTLTLQRRDQTLLDAALQAGIELPYACKGGVCSTCRARLLEGEVDMDANFALEDYEIAQGYILSCQSYPVTDAIVVDFDQ